MTHKITEQLRTLLKAYAERAAKVHADAKPVVDEGEQRPHRDDRDGSPDRRVGRDQDAELHRGRAQGQLTSYAATIASRIRVRLVRAASVIAAVDSPPATRRLTISSACTGCSSSYLACSSSHHRPFGPILSFLPSPHSAFSEIRCAMPSTA